MFRCGVLFLLKDGTEQLAFVCRDTGGTYSSGDDYLSLSGGRERAFNTEADGASYLEKNKKYFRTEIPFGLPEEKNIVSRKFVVMKVSYDIVVNID